MAEPKQKLTRTRRARRRHSIHTPIQNGISCPNCKTLIKRHTVCSGCGQYKGEKII